MASKKQTESLSEFDAVLAKISAKYGDKLKRGNEIENPRRLSTGSLELDIAMGGGAPLGRRIRLAGPYSCGKTLICWNLIANAQAEGQKCAYFNVEKQYTPDFVASRGVNIEDLLVIDETTIEGIAEILDALLTVVDLVVIDSTKAAVSIDALNASVSDWRPGLEARAWGKAMAVINERFDQSRNTLILVDQVRVKNFQHGGEEPAGGKVLDHASDMTVIFRKGTYLYYDGDGYLSEAGKESSQTSAKQHVPAGRLIQGRVEKSRVSRPLLPATMMLDLNTSNFDKWFEFSKAAKEYGVVEVRAGGNYYYPATGDDADRERLHGETKLRMFIEQHPSVQEEIRQVAFGEKLTDVVADEPEEEAVEEKPKPKRKAPAKKTNVFKQKAKAAA